MPNVTPAGSEEFSIIWWAREPQYRGVDRSSFHRGGMGQESQIQQNSGFLLWKEGKNPFDLQYAVLWNFGMLKFHFNKLEAFTLCYVIRPKLFETWITPLDRSLANRPFHGFDMDRLGKIRQEHWKARLEISTIAKFESDTSQACEEYSSAKSRKFTDLCPPPYNRL